MTTPPGLEALGLVTSALAVAVVAWAVWLAWPGTAPPGTLRDRVLRWSLVASAALSVALALAGALPTVPLRTASTFFAGPDAFSDHPVRIETVSRGWTVPALGTLTHRRVTQGSTLLREEYEVGLIPPLPLLAVLLAGVLWRPGGAVVRRPPPRL